jgi:hypothetical protein
MRDMPAARRTPQPHAQATGADSGAAATSVARGSTAPSPAHLPAVHGIGAGMPVLGQKLKKGENAEQRQDAARRGHRERKMYQPQAPRTPLLLPLVRLLQAPFSAPGAEKAARISPLTHEPPSTDLPAPQALHVSSLGPYNPAQHLKQLVRSRQTSRNRSKTVDSMDQRVRGKWVQAGR